MADAKQYTSVTGFNPDGAPGGSAGSEPASKIISEDIRDLKHDLWAAFWGLGPNCPAFNSGDEADRRIGWNQDDNGVEENTWYQTNSSPTKNIMGGISGYPAASSGDNGAVTTSNVQVLFPTDTTNTSGSDETPIDYVAMPAGGFNYKFTTTVHFYQIQAILTRVNDAILHTGHGSSSNATMPLLSTAGSYTKYDGSAASALTEDTGRVSKRHLDRISTEIEYIRADYERANELLKGRSDYWSQGTYYARTDTGQQWGSDYWPGNQWVGASGTNTGIERPFHEARFVFNDWPHLRYFFNQGGQLEWKHGGSDGSRTGDSSWNTIHNHRCFFGATNPEYRTGTSVTGANSTQTNVQWGSSNGGAFTVTGYAPRVHMIGDHANANITGTGATTTDGLVITGLSTTTNVAVGDRISVKHAATTDCPFVGEVKSIDSSSQVTLRRKIRNTCSGADVTSFSSEPFSFSKWYRIGYLQGINSLYGGFSDDTDDGYIYFDWAYSEEPGTSGKNAIVIRSMCDNSVNQMLMGDHQEHGWNYSYCDDHNEFKAEDEPYALSLSFSTAEDEWNGSANVRYASRNRMTDAVTMS